MRKISTLPHYGLITGINAQVNGLCVHSLRAAAATNVLSHQVDIVKAIGKIDYCHPNPWPAAEGLLNRSLLSKWSTRKKEVGRILATESEGRPMDRPRPFLEVYPETRQEEEVSATTSAQATWPSH
jgi:hypothetical protein